MRHTDLARKLRLDQTDAEKRLWDQLRGRRFLGLKFKRQVPIEGYIADFYCEQEKLIIELDGGQHADAQEYDTKRTSVLEQAGFRVLRYWNNDVHENLDGVLMDITRFVGGT